ncbi:MAG TPA: hypothetical protein VG474_00900 [Solirubrobacteraceae bacterium]|nr:hypothetical protein [Solirubrobacteraceae bacterium]
MCDDPAASPAAAQAGLAHVATASFLTSRVVPTGGFAVALAGGVALARTGRVAGLRTGYGASLAAMLQAIAVLGPSRISVPLTQALSAPLLGRLHARGARLATQIAACAAIRASDQVAFTLFYIWIIAGGVETYAATYDAIIGRIPGLPGGTTGALAATGFALVAWTAFASVVQVLVYRGALRAWPLVGAGGAAPAQPRAGARAGTGAAPGDALAAGAPPHPRYDPRAVALAAVVAFVVLVATTAWPVLAAVAAWLAIASATARADRSPVRAGLALAALLAGGALAFGLIGGAGLELTLQRTVRAGLLVLVATWLRAAAGERGLREVARRSLRCARRVPAVGEASEILDRLGATGALGASGRALVADVRRVRRRPGVLAIAVLRWVAAEAERFHAAPPPVPARPRLRAAWRDRLLVATMIAAVAGAVMAA